MPDDAASLENVTLGEVYRLVVRLDTKVDLLGKHYVPIELWRQRNEQVDDRFKATGLEIAGLRERINQRHVPWPSVAAVVVGATALGLSIVQAIGG